MDELALGASTSVQVEANVAGQAGPGGLFTGRTVGVSNKPTIGRVALVSIVLEKNVFVGSSLVEAGIAKNKIGLFNDRARFSSLPKSRNRVQSVSPHWDRQTPPWLALATPRTLADSMSAVARGNRVGLANWVIANPTPPPGRALADIRTNRHPIKTGRR